MRAVGLFRYLPIEHPESLLDLDLPEPQPGPHDLKVAIKAIAVNPVDTKVRAPKEKVEATPRILGWDAAGIVEAVGDAVTLFAPGDRVFYAGDITRPGSNAQYQLVDERIVGKAPASLGFAAAAALPLTAITAWESLFERLHLDFNGTHAGQSLLILGGAGGVGSIGIQLAKFAGLKVIATASRADSIAWCRSLGADIVINHNDDLNAQLAAHGLATVDHIACFNNSDQHFPAMADLIRPQGSIVTIVENAHPLAVEKLKSKSAALAWEFMFTRSMFQTPDMIEQHRLLNRVSELVDAGRLKTTLSEILGPINATNLKLAHAKLEGGHTVGKLVLEGLSA